MRLFCGCRSCRDGRKLTALLRLALALLRSSGFTLTHERLPDGRAKMRIGDVPDVSIHRRGCLITDSRPPELADPCVSRRLPKTSRSRGRPRRRPEPCPRCKSLLICGDASADVLAGSIRRLIRQRGESRLRVDAIVVPHGGRAHNLHRQLLELLDCERYLIATSGERYRHPDRETIARILAFGPTDRSVPLTLVFQLPRADDGGVGRPGAAAALELSRHLPAARRRRDQSADLTVR